MDVPGYSLAERDRRWALARTLMAAEDVQALIAWGGQDGAGRVAFAPDAYFSNDRRRSVVIFCRDADPVQLVGPDPPAPARPESGRAGGHMWIGPGRIRAALTVFGPAGGSGCAGWRWQTPREHSCAQRPPGIPAICGDLPLAPGMSWAFGPSAMVGGRAVIVGGTVVIAQDGPVELNPFTARLLRVGSTRLLVGEASRARGIA
jgi:hypothetical protein